MADEDRGRRSISSSAELGDLIRRTRVASKLRQADAAALCGVSQPFLIALEHGKPTVRVDAVLKVCRGLGIAIELVAPIEIAAEGRSSLPRGPKRTR